MKAGKYTETMGIMCHFCRITKCAFSSSRKKKQIFQNFLDNSLVLLFVLTYNIYIG